MHTIYRAPTHDTVSTGRASVSNKRNRQRIAEKRLVRSGAERRGGLGTENAYPRDEEPASQSWHGTTATSSHPPAATAAVDAATAAAPSISPRNWRNVYIFPLYTLPMFIPFSRLQRFQIHVIKLAGSAACAHAKYIYTDR